MRVPTIFAFTGVSLAALALGGTPAFAQESDVQPGPDAVCQNVPEGPERDRCISGEVELESGEDVAQESGPIVVTGSRIRRPNLESAVPITSVGAEDLVDRGDISLGDALNELPALRSTWSQSNSTRFIGTAGLNLLDLRGLGSSRTLVLVNNRRHVSSQPGAYTVDVNTIPSDLLERVDVVTGGNSAVYGSDAIAGVVNFITRRDFEGLRLRGQGGISHYGDRGSYFASLTAGRNFLGDRLNIAGALEYAQSDALFHKDRPEMTGAFHGVPSFMTTQPTHIFNPVTRLATAIPNRNDDGIPNTQFFDPGPMSNIRSSGGSVNVGCPYLTNAQYDALSPAARARHIARLQATCVAVGTDAQGRVIPTVFTPTGGALDNAYMFNPDGTLALNVLSGDARATGGGTFGGRGVTGVEEAMLQPGLKRFAGNIFVNADISPALQPFLEAKYVRIRATQSSNQPTFSTGFLRNSFRFDNPFLTDQARQTLITIMGLDPNSAAVQQGTQTFVSNRWNYDLGTRQENHRRDTYRIVGGVAGNISETGNLRYEAALNWGRTETYYETGGNVHRERYNWATDAVRDPATGQIVCRATLQGVSGAQGCVPLNPFGHFARSEAAAQYVLHTSWREQWTKQLNAVAYISGDSGGFFNLPGGPVGFATGVEYRREDAYSAYDDVTVSGATFLNAIGAFDPPAQTIKEAFGELRVPFLRNVRFAEELSIEGAVRVSDYNTHPDPVWAWNVGAIWAPVKDLRLRAGYARSVRAPDIGDLFATAAETFFNSAVDPCSQNVIGDNPNRAKNCEAHGVPTTMIINGQERPWINTTIGGISGISSGNPDLQPERGTSFSVGAVFQPRFVPGLSMTIDYYDVEVTSVIASLTAQAIVNACYDDPTGVNNQYCAAVFRRRSSDPLADFTFRGQPNRNFAAFGGSNNYQLPLGDGPGFIQAPFNFAKLTARGIDLDVAYRTRLWKNVELNTRGILSRNLEREDYTFQNDPKRSTRIHGTLGDPLWAANLNNNIDFGVFDFGYNLRYISKMAIAAWETQHSHQGRPPQVPDAFPVKYYPEVFYHNLRFGFEPPETNYRFYMGVDNVLNTLPPFGLDGTGGGGAIYPNTGRFFYAGAQIKY
ncbi:MAG TPA: TonB-dependent receptor [Sphingomicrobium sp.]|nr:TonB-dependent receptor [Sphingomicrobium sp.]